MCKWVEEHWVLLQERLAKYQLYDDQLATFAAWLDDKDKILANMEALDAADINQVIEQVRQLKVSRCTSHKASQWREMFCLDLQVTSLNPQSHLCCWWEVLSKFDLRQIG